jgi:hypothetical protein
VTVLRPELDASGVSLPSLAALRAGGGQLLVPSDPAIAAIWRVSHSMEGSSGSAFRLAGPARGAAHGIQVPRAQEPQPRLKIYGQRTTS